MAVPGINVDVNLDLKLSDTTIDRALIILDWYLADHPDKTIVVKQEGHLRVCLIAEREEKHSEEE
jgi:hypothetical protein